MKYQIAVSLIAGILAFPAVASAGPIQHSINHENQRIYQGVRSGSLTYGEANRLDRNNERIQTQRNRALQTGGISSIEAHRLNHELSHQSSLIYQLKHNPSTSTNPHPILNQISSENHRIYQGVQTGSLTYSEANRLDHNNDRIQAERARDIRSNGLSPAEAQRLNHQLDHQSALIYRLKHN